MTFSTRSTSPRFLSYLAASALGAMNDNAFKLGVLVLALSSVDDEPTRLAYSSVITIVFALPWLIFSPLAGYFADRYPKDRVLLATKVPEVVFMALGVVGFAYENVPMLLIVFFLMSAQAAFYSPPKYGMLPEVFGEAGLAHANGVLGMTSSVAVLVGTVLGTLLGAERATLGNIGWIYLGIALLGTAFAAYVPRTPAGFAAAPFRWEPVRQTLADYRIVRDVPVLRPTIIGLMLFTFLSSLLLTVVPVYCIDVLGLDASRAAVVITALVLGVAGGSGTAGYLSRGRVELGLVPLGIWLTTLAALDVAFLPPSPANSQASIPLRVLVDFVMIGMGGGLFSIPLTAHLQQQSPEEQKGQIIAYSNVAANLVICAAALLPLLAGAFTGMIGISRGAIRFQMVLLAAIAFGGALYFTFRLPDFLARFTVYVLVSVFYRVRTEGTHHIPRGGALLVADRVSWSDALVIAAASGRMVRFLMHRPFYEARGLRWLFRQLHAIPIGAADVAEALERARQELAAGHAVCLLAEGSVTRPGRMLELRQKLEHIAGGMQRPIVPVSLDGLLGSVFSFKDGKVLLERPRRFRQRIRVAFGRPSLASEPSELAYGTRVAPDPW